MHAAAHMLALRRAGAAAARLRAAGASEAEVARARAELRVAGLDAAAGAAAGKPRDEMRVSDAPRAAPLAEIAATTARQENAMVVNLVPRISARISAQTWINDAENARNHVIKMNTRFNQRNAPTDAEMDAFRAFDAGAIVDRYDEIPRALLSTELSVELDEERALLDTELPNIERALDKLSVWHDVEFLYQRLLTEAGKIAEENERRPPSGGFYVRGYFLRKIANAHRNYEDLVANIENAIAVSNLGETDREAVWGKVDAKLDAVGNRTTRIIEQYEIPKEPVLDEKKLKAVIATVRQEKLLTPAKTLPEMARAITGEQPITEVRVKTFVYYKTLVAYVRPDLYFETADGAADAIRELCTSRVPGATAFKLEDRFFTILFLAAMPYTMRNPDAWERTRNLDTADAAAVRQEATELLLLDWDPARSHYADMSWMPAANKAVLTADVLNTIRESETLDEAIAVIYAFPM